MMWRMFNDELHLPAITFGGEDSDALREDELMRLSDLRVRLPENPDPNERYFTRPATIADLLDALREEGAEIVETTDRWLGIAKHPIPHIGHYLIFRIPVELQERFDRQHH